MVGRESVQVSGIVMMDVGEDVVVGGLGPGFAWGWGMGAEEVETANANNQ